MTNDNTPDPKELPSVLATILDGMVDKDEVEQDLCLITMYGEASNQEKATMDRLLICICGSSFPTLLKMATKRAAVYVAHSAEPAGPPSD